MRSLTLTLYAATYHCFFTIRIRMFIMINWFTTHEISCCFRTLSSNANTTIKELGPRQSYRHTGACIYISVYIQILHIRILLTQTAASSTEMCAHNIQNKRKYNTQEKSENTDNTQIYTRTFKSTLRNTFTASCSVKLPTMQWYKDNENEHKYDRVQEKLSRQIWLIGDTFRISFLNSIAANTHYGVCSTAL